MRRSVGMGAPTADGISRWWWRCADPKGCGRISNNRLIPGICEHVIELIRSRYADFGPSLAAEVLFEKDGVKVSRETLRRWMVKDGLWQ